MSPRRIERPGNIGAGQRPFWLNEDAVTEGEPVEAEPVRGETVRSLADMVATRPGSRSITARPDLDAVISAYKRLHSELKRREALGGYGGQGWGFWKQAASLTSAVLAGLRKGSISHALFQDLMYINNRIQDPAAFRNGLMLLMVFNLAYVYEDIEDESRPFEFVKDSEPLFRGLIILDRAGFNPEVWTDKHLSILSEMLDSGQLLSIASLKAWTEKIGPHSAPLNLVYKFLYTFLFYGGRDCGSFAEDFGEWIVRHSGNRAFIEAAIPLGFVAASLQDRINDPFIYGLLRTALDIMPRHSREWEGDNLQRIVQYITVFLGYMAVNEQRTGNAAVNYMILAELQEDGPLSYDNADAHALSRLCANLEAIVQMLGNPELREYVATTESMDELIEIYREHSDVSTSVAEEARDGRQRRRTPPRRGNPRGNRTLSHASATARIRRSPRIGLTARMATRFRAV